MTTAIIAFIADPPAYALNHPWIPAVVFVVGVAGFVLTALAGRR